MRIAVKDEQLGEAGPLRVIDIKIKKCRVILHVPEINCSNFQTLEIVFFAVTN